MNPNVGGVGKKQFLFGIFFNTAITSTNAIVNSSSTKQYVQHSKRVTLLMRCYISQCNFPFFVHLSTVNSPPSQQLYSALLFRIQRKIIHNSNLYRAINNQHQLECLKSEANRNKMCPYICLRIHYW